MPETSENDKTERGQGTQRRPFLTSYMDVGALSHCCVSKLWKVENSRNLLLSTFLILLKVWQFEMLDPRPSAISQCLKIKYLTDFVLFVCFCCVLFRFILFRNDLSVATADLELIKPWAFCLPVSASWALVLQTGTTSPDLKFIKFLCHWGVLAVQHEDN